MATARSTAVPRTVRVADPLWAKATRKAGKDRRSVSEVVRHALEQYASGDLVLPDERP